MAATDIPQLREPSAAPVVAISSLTLLSGAGGMAISFSFLASPDYLDVIAGAVGFVAGSIFVVAGVISLALQSRSPTTSQIAVHAAGCLVGFLPPTIAALGWPTLYFGLFLAVLLMPLVLIGCIWWAWGQSHSVAEHLSQLIASRRIRLIRFIIFVVQSLAIVATWPLFGYFLRTLESMGYKIGWS